MLLLPFRQNGGSAGMAARSDPWGVLLLPFRQSGGSTGLVYRAFSRHIRVEIMIINIMVDFIMIIFLTNKFLKI